MFRRLVIILALVWLIVPELRSQACTNPGVRTSVRRVKAQQANLLAFRLDGEMDESVPAPLQAKIRSFKDALAALADAAVSCNHAGINPNALETSLAELLDANKPEVREVYDPDKPPQIDRIYGDNIRVKVTAIAKPAPVLLIAFNFGIECGYDSVLLAYEQRNGQWQRVLRWQSADYSRIDDAFGDFFSYLVIPASGNTWSVAVAHGHPWCTSNMSAFNVDVIAPQDGHNPQKVIAHSERGYRRDTDPVMKPVPGGIQLRMTGSSMDPDIVMRPVIYRFSIANDGLIRVQPIANNGRDFVDEWLESPWEEAARWSSPAHLTDLQAEHDRVMKLYDSAEGPLQSFGPVRGCADSPNHFQVELKAEWVDGKGNKRPDKSTFFQIEEGENSFAMLNASRVADPRCTGRDIMPSQ